MTTTDFNALERRARAMHVDELLGGMDDIRRALPLADALDRDDGCDRGGMYRDQSSVFHGELTTRKAFFRSLSLRCCKCNATATTRIAWPGKPTPMFTCDTHTRDYVLTAESMQIRGIVRCWRFACR